MQSCCWNSLINSSSSSSSSHPLFSSSFTTINTPPCWKTSSSWSSASSMVCCCSRRSPDQNFGGRYVDESMIILRKRIHEMNMIEKNYEAPSDWMEWEKRYYTSYDSMICEAMGVLQRQLMNTRPSVALGTIALLAITLPTSSALLFLHLLELAKSLLVAVN